MDDKSKVDQQLADVKVKADSDLQTLIDTHNQVNTTLNAIIAKANDDIMALKAQIDVLKAPVLAAPAATIEIIKQDTGGKLLQGLIIGGIIGMGIMNKKKRGK